MEAATLDDFRTAAREIQNRIGRRVGSEDMERRFFREFFGTSLTIAWMVWNLLIDHHRLPEKGKPKHLLWTLYFFKVYPKTGPGCACVGGPSGAIDPKTFRKWIWKFADAICELHVEVVSYNLLYSSLCYIAEHHPRLHFLFCCCHDHCYLD